MVPALHTAAADLVPPRKVVRVAAVGHGQCRAGPLCPCLAPHAPAATRPSGRRPASCSSPRRTPRASCRPLCSPCGSPWTGTRAGGSPGCSSVLRVRWGQGQRNGPPPPSRLCGDPSAPAGTPLHPGGPLCTRGVASAPTGTPLHPGGPLCTGRDASAAAGTPLHRRGPLCTRGTPLQPQGPLCTRRARALGQRGRAVTLSLGDSTAETQDNKADTRTARHANGATVPRLTRSREWCLHLPSAPWRLRQEHA